MLHTIFSWIRCSPIAPVSEEDSEAEVDRSVTQLKWLIEHWRRGGLQHDAFEMHFSIEMRRYRCVAPHLWVAEPDRARALTRRHSVAVQDVLDVLNAIDFLRAQGYAQNAPEAAKGFALAKVASRTKLPSADSNAPTPTTS